MPELIVVSRAGAETTVTSPADRTVMQVIRDAGFDDMLALCGGCCSCSTCHVFVDPTLADLLPGMSEDENDFLDGLRYRNDQSRLSCQIHLTEELSGLTVTIAPED